MKRLLSLFVAVVLGGCTAPVGVDGPVAAGETFTPSLPAVLPPPVVVEPGVSVVPDVDEEVFYSDGYYWARRDMKWFRARDHRRAWGRVEDREVPGSFARSPPGRYRHYRHDRRDAGQPGDREHGGRDMHDRDHDRDSDHDRDHDRDRGRDDDRPVRPPSPP